MVSLFRMFVLFACCLTVFSCGSPRLVLTPASNVSTSLSNTSVRNIVVKGDIDLEGKTITLPSQSVLDIRNGSIRNGTIVLNCTRIDCIDTRGLNCVIKGTCSNKELVVNNENYGVYQLASMENGASVTLVSDIIVNKTLKINCNIIGNDNPTIKAANGVSVLLNLMSSGITLRDLSLEIANDKALSKCYIIYSKDVENIKLCNLSVRGGSIYIRNTNDTHYRGYEITNCSFEVDFSKCDQSFERQNDAFEFRGLQNLIFQNNKIKTINITRVFKTPASSVSRTPCDNLVFINNEIVSDCSNGKQVFDFYDFTRNVIIKGNHIVAKGHTDVFENKTKGDKSSINILIENNTIEYDYRLMYFNFSDEGENSITIYNNVFVSTSSQSQRESIKNGEVEKGQRTYDCNFRNLKHLSIKGNVFDSKYPVNGLLFYFDTIGKMEILSNDIDGTWERVAILKGYYDEAVFSDNKEIRKSLILSTLPVITFSSAKVNRFITNGNQINNRRGDYFVLQNASNVTCFIRKGDSNISSLFRLRDKSELTEIED